MLMSPTMEKLKLLRLLGMAKALEEQQKIKTYEKLEFNERLGHMVDAEQLDRDNKRLSSRLYRARLRHKASIEDINYHHPRKLDKALVRKLANCHWVKEHHNLIITGPTGVGKSYIGCALAHKACLEGYNSVYYRATRMFASLEVAKAEGRYAKVLQQISKMDLLIIDDWGLTKLNPREEQELLEVMEDRYELRSTILVSQIPLKDWHELIPNKTIADAVLDRIVHNAYRMELDGPSLRKTENKSLADRKNDEK